MFEAMSLQHWGLVPAFLWGAIWGSFFNVVIHRLPAGISLVSPPSQCPACDNKLKAIHNIPLLSWLFLRGRCGFCDTGISVRYPMVELVTGALSVAVWVVVMESDVGRMALSGQLVGAIAAYLVLFAFVGALVVITFIDLDLQIIPHKITLPFIVTGVAASFVLEPVTGLTWSRSVLGALLGGGLIWLVIEGYFLIRKREGMGGGDFMMMAMLGAWLGYESLLFILLAASLQGLVAAAMIYGVTQVRAGKSEEDDFRYMAIAFGPFLALGGLEWLFFEPWISEVIYGMYAME